MRTVKTILTCDSCGGIMREDSYLAKEHMHVESIQLTSFRAPGENILLRSSDDTPLDFCSMGCLTSFFREALNNLNDTIDNQPTEEVEPEDL